MLDAAERLVAEEGIDALTLGRLAKELHLVPAALYRYFASKDALVVELQRRTIAGLHERFAEKVQDGPPLTRLLSAGRFYLALPSDEPLTYRLLTHLLGDPRPLVRDDEALRVAPALMAFLSDVAGLHPHRPRAEALGPGDEERRALVLWGALQGVCQLGKLARFDEQRFDTTALGEDLLATLLAGWGASPAALAETKRRN